MLDCQRRANLIEIGLAPRLDPGRDPAAAATACVDSRIVREVRSVPRKMDTMRIGHGRRVGALCAVATLGLLVGCTSGEGTGVGAAGEDSTLVVATAGPPSSLDPHSSSAFLDQQIAWHIYEGLWTIDSTFQAQPMLAESGELDPETNIFTITLRDGVTFQDGSSLDSGDVVASLERWEEKASYGAIFSDIVTDIAAPSKLVVELTLNEPSPVIEQLLAFPNQQAAIMSSEAIEAAGSGPIDDPVGTGPYQLDEHVLGQYVRLTKFDDYVPREEEPDGLAGRREASFDTIELRPTPEVSVRRDAVITGQVDVAQSISPDMLGALQDASDVEPLIVKPYWWSMAVFDKSEAPFDDVNARRAFLAALDMGPIMQAAFGTEEFYRLEPGILQPEQELWASDAGSDVYNQQDLDAARALLAESGYDGEEITWLTTREYPYMYTNATVAEQQLEAVGFNITLEVVDYATIVDRRTRPAEFDIFSGATTFTADPGIWPCWDETWPGNWQDPTKDEIVQRLNAATDVTERQAIWGEAQEYFYDQVPMVKFGDLFDLSAYASGLDGMESGPFPRFWGVSDGTDT